MVDPKPGKIETGRWYDIRIELSGGRIRCYFDGKLIHDIAHPVFKPLYAVASRVDATGDVVLKMVNTCWSTLGRRGQPPRRERPGIARHGDGAHFGQSDGREQSHGPRQGRPDHPRGRHSGPAVPATAPALVSYRVADQCRTLDRIHFISSVWGAMPTLVVGMFSRDRHMATQAWPRHPPVQWRARWPPKQAERAGYADSITTLAY